MIGIIIIVLVVILGGAYLWGKNLKESVQETGTSTTSSASDETASIEASLDANNPDTIDIDITK